MAAAGKRLGLAAQILGISNVRSGDEHIAAQQLSLNLLDLLSFQLPRVFPCAYHGTGQLSGGLPRQGAGVHHPAGNKGLTLGADVPSRKEQVGHPVLIQASQGNLIDIHRNLDTVFFLGVVHSSGRMGIHVPSAIESAVRKLLSFPDIVLRQ